ncbi:MAG: hypothetical protein KA885_06320 [Spirochaetes bacterium]|nr:hypothetical protein [Spirochaetota bacterium]
MKKIKKTLSNSIKLIVALCLTLSAFGCDVYNWTLGMKLKDAEQISSFDTWIPIDVGAFSEKYYYVTGSYPDEIQWSDTSEAGWGAPTGDIEVTIYESDGDYEEHDDNGYSDPLDFDNDYNSYDEKTYIKIVTKSAGIVYIKVNASSSSW